MVVNLLQSGQAFLTIRQSMVLVFLVVLSLLAFEGLLLLFFPAAFPLSVDVLVAPPHRLQHLPDFFSVLAEELMFFKFLSGNKVKSIVAAS